MVRTESSNTALMASKTAAAAALDCAGRQRGQVLVPDDRRHHQHEGHGQGQPGRRPDQPAAPVDGEEDRPGEAQQGHDRQHQGQVVEDADQALCLG